MLHSASVRSWRPREELALSLTPFGSRYDNPLYGEDDLDELPTHRGYPWYLGDEPVEEFYWTFEMDTQLVKDQIDQSYPSYDVPHETDLVWKQYEDDNRPEAVVDEPRHLTNTEVLDKRLAEMAWLHTPHNNRRPNAKAKGWRYATPGDHGTAIARKLNTALRRERLRKARQNRHTKHYTPDWKLRARRVKMATWSAGQDDMFDMAKYGTAHGLFYIGLAKACTDPWCCPVDIFDPWEESAYGSYGYDPYYDEDGYQPLARSGYRDMSFDW